MAKKEEQYPYFSNDLQRVNKPQDNQQNGTQPQTRPQPNQYRQSIPQYPPQMQYNPYAQQVDYKKMKTCKHCKQYINKKASRCPYCGGKQGGLGQAFLFVIFLMVLWAGFATYSGYLDRARQKQNNTYTENNFVKVDIATLCKELEENAIAARNKYKGQYIEFTGVLSVIDSEGKYVSVAKSKTELFESIHCSIKDTATKNKLSTIKSGTTITVRAKCTEVGELAGYIVDIIQIVD